MIPESKLSETLRKKRQKIDETQQKISDLTDLSVTQISRIENNDINYSYKDAYQLWKTLKELEKDYQNVEDVMNSSIHWASPEDTILQIKKVMRENDYSQLPVKKDGNQVGRIDSKILMGIKNPDEEIEDYIGPEYSEVNPETPLDSVKALIKQDSAVLVQKDGEYLGIVTRADIIC